MTVDRALGWSLKELLIELGWGLRHGGRGEGGVPLGGLRGRKGMELSLGAVEFGLKFYS